ncbi:hypothetical protein NDU88_004076 [Pleurodeles waltl]|uniref:Uncharacterized protein n=1 Tax=Pleurodeles waltl TaxID=8319 RepID=A0AAV7RKA5_PLEWA|nr:hypothetical protein NDU88_004076 [Pleurodeles waltl]
MPLLVPSLPLLTRKHLQVPPIARDGDERERKEREENDEGDDGKGTGRESNGGGDRMIQCPHGGIRSIRGQEEGDAKEVGGPNRGRRVRTPGSRTRLPAMLQEERGKGRSVAVA